MYANSNNTLELLLPVASVSNELAIHAAKIAYHNFEWRYITLVIFNSSIVVNGVDKFVTLYRKSNIISKGLFYPAFSENTRQSVIFGVDLDDMARMLHWMNFHQFDNTGKYIAICRSNCDEFKAVEMFWNYKIVNVVFITMKKGKVFGYTYFFSGKTCKYGRPMRIERFSACKFDKRSCFGFFPEKLNNLYRCPLIVSTFKQIPFMNFRNGQPEGADGDLLLIIAEAMNASLKTVTPRDGDGWGWLDNYGRWSGSLSDVLHDLANFSMTSAAITLSRFSHFQMSNYYYRTSINWFTHSAELKPSSLKLFHPFRPLSLLIIVVSFVIVVTLVCLMKIKYCCYRYYYHSSTSPCDSIFDIWTLCMGIPIIKLPTKTTFLYLTFTWIWYCFLLRTLYQVYLIGSLQGDFYYNQINTIEEAYQTDYLFGGGGALKDYYIDNPPIRDNWNNVNTTDIIPTLIELNKGKKFVLAMNLDTAKTVINEQELSIYILPQPVIISPSVLFFKKFSPLADPLNIILLRLIESGFTEKLYKNHSIRLLQMEEKILIPINMEHYTACYVILALGWITSTMMFLSELTFYKMQKSFQEHVFVSHLTIRQPGFRNI